VNPVPFPQANRLFVAPDGMTEEEVGGLPVHDSGSVLISCWQPTEEERVAIAGGAPIWLSVFGRGHPVVAIQAECPFIPLASPTPITTQDPGADAPAKEDDKS